MNDYSKVLKNEIEKRMSIKPLVFANGVDEMVKFVANKLTETMKVDHLKYDSWLTMATMGIPFAVEDEMFDEVLELSMQDVFWGIIEHFADTKTDAVTMAVILTKMKKHIYNFMTKDEVAANLALLKKQDKKYERIVINFIGDTEVPRNEMTLYCIINNIDIFRLKNEDDNKEFKYDRFTINNLLKNDAEEKLWDLINVAVLFQRNKFMYKLIEAAKQNYREGKFDIGILINLIVRAEEFHGINRSVLLKTACKLEF